MPSILLRHITAEILRILLLTASVLVAVIAFGAAIRPIMQNLLGAEDVLQYVAQASIPMMQFALPFSGAFAATIVYSRLSAENEVVAMSAAGLSYRRVLMPAVWLGAVLLVVMVLLVDAAVPRFWTSMQQLLARDVTRLFVAAVDRGEALVIGNKQIYADAAEVLSGEQLGKEGAAGPKSRLILAGVAALELGDDGRPTTEFTAEFATVDVYREASGAHLKLLFQNATAFDADEGALVHVPQAEPEAIDLGQGLRRKPKELDFRELLGVWRNIEGYHGVADPRARAVAALGAVDAWRYVASRLDESGEIRLVDHARRRTFEVRNARLAGDRLVPRAGEVIELVELDRGSLGRRAEVRGASLRRDGRGRDSDMRLELVVRQEDMLDQNAPRRWPPRISGLAPSAFTPRDRSSMGIAEIGSEARALPRIPGADAADPVVAARTAAVSAASAMDESVRLVRADIVARIVQRANQSLCAPLILILGAVLAIRLRGANPLQVYLLAFIPAIADILLISGGEQMLRDGTSALGIVVACSGNLAVALMILFAYRQVARN